MIKIVPPMNRLSEEAFPTTSTVREGDLPSVEKEFIDSWSLLLLPEVAVMCHLTTVHCFPWFGRRSILCSFQRAGARVCGGYTPKGEQTEPKEQLLKLSKDWDLW